MYKMANEYGNIEKIVDSDIKKAVLEKSGYKVVSGTAEAHIVPLNVDDMESKGVKGTDFDDMTVNELKAYAENNQIELPKRAKREEILLIIKENSSAMPVD